MIIYESIEINQSIDKNILFFFSPSPINNKTTCFSSQHLFWYMDWMFCLIFITENVNPDGILFPDSMKVSSFDWKFYVFRIKSFYKIFISFCNSPWIMVCRIQVSDQKPLKPFIIISILNIDQAFSWMV